MSKSSLPCQFNYNPTMRNQKKSWSEEEEKKYNKETHTLNFSKSEVFSFLFLFREFCGFFWSVQLEMQAHY